MDPSLRRNRIRLGFGEQSRVDWARQLTLSRPARIVRPQRDWSHHKRTIRRLRRILIRHDETFPAPFACFQRDRQDASHWSQFTGKRQLSTDVAVIQFRNLVLLVQLQHRERNWKIKARPLLADGRGSQINDNLSAWPPQRAVAKRTQNPIPTLFDRGIRQTNDCDLSIRSPPGMHFNLDLESIHPHYCCRIDLRWHNSVRKCYFFATFARIVLLCGVLQFYVPLTTQTFLHHGPIRGLRLFPFDSISVVVRSINRWLNKTRSFGSKMRINLHPTHCQRGIARWHRKLVSSPAPQKKNPSDEKNRKIVLINPLTLQLVALWFDLPQTTELSFTCHT